MESEWRQQACRDLVMEAVENAMMESRRRVCKQVTMETIVIGAWEALEVRRIVKNAKEGGVERMESVEAELRSKREERECILSIIAEEDESKRMEKLKMNSKRWSK